MHLKRMDYSILLQCIHCGLCLPTCPTYAETKLERHSPRGRIALMRAIAMDELPLTRAFGEELYFCLGCLACQTACPAGVNYAKLFEAARADIEEMRVLANPLRDLVRGVVVGFVFCHPRALRALGRLLYLYQASGLERLVRQWKLTRLLPRRLRELEPLLPRIQRHFSDALIREVETLPVRKYRVGLLTGCVQDLIYPQVNRDTADVLLANGCEVVTPRLQYCCGSLHAHNGELERARELARRNMDAFDLDSLDAIITNAGGCGSHLKNYGELLADDPRYAARARQWSAKVKDIHEWLVEIGVRKPQATLPARRVTYHESCHLCHGQRVAWQPREVLKVIPNLELVELPESNWCCGSAGIYNITQPEMAQKLLARKQDRITATQAAVVASANPGCSVQLESVAGTFRVAHPVTLLAEAYRVERKGGGA